MNDDLPLDEQTLRFVPPGCEQQAAEMRRDEKRRARSGFLGANRQPAEPVEPDRVGRVTVTISIIVSIVAVLWMVTYLSNHLARWFIGTH